MEVEPATRADLPDVHAAYETGRALQRAQRSVVWPAFTDGALLREIDAGTLYCVRDGSVLAGVFTVIDNDALIWGAHERNAHLYLHRITRAAEYRGRGLIDAVLAWSFDECGRRDREGLRMDTWASNAALIAYYAARGFRLVATRVMPADPRLSPHYHGIELALLEAPCTLA